MEKKIYRAMDASISRALEGLRVCEDLLRFVVDSGDSAAIKEFRHTISAYAKKLPWRSLLHERDVEQDQQKFFDTAGERKRRSAGDILSANLGRVIEAVRSLEEFSKMLDGESSAELQALRFRLYEFEKRALLHAEKRLNLQRLPGALYAIIDSAFIAPGDFPETALRLARGGAQVIQLRMKGAPSGEVFAAARTLSRICREQDSIFIVNDHPDIAYLAGAQGVHLGQEDLPVREARKFLPGDMIIGKSTHSYEQAMEAADEGPDYIAVGPVFDTGSKHGSLITGIGTDVLRRICGDARLPVVAIGGIRPENARSVMDAGASSCAVISGLYRGGDIGENCRKYREAMQ